jgi:Rod binding domain-containing protein
MSIQALVVPTPVGTIQPARVPLKNETARIRQAATDFEALLLAQMLRSAREAGGQGLTGGDDDEDEANSSMMELSEQHLAQALASSGGFGIAKMVVAGLTKNADR